MDKGIIMTEEHIVTSFDDELTELTDGLVNLGNLAQVALSNVEMALKTNDHNLAQETIDEDKKINEFSRYY